VPRQVFPTSGLLVSPGFSHAVRAGDFIHVSGQVARDADGRLVGNNDPEAQARQVFHNIGRALSAAGAGSEDVVKITVFVTNAADRASVSRVRDESFAEPRPASTFLVVAALAEPDLLVEVEAVAHLPQDR
jgi:enamine deaminase RidA (YjgF/YER057c/UK114 family)